MADTFVNVTQGSGTKMSADLVSGVNYPIVKVALGDSGTATDLSQDNPMPIAIGGVPLKNYSENSGSLSDVIVASITLSANKIYESLSWAIGCFQTMEGNLIYNNNGSEIVLTPIMLSSSQNFHAVEIPSMQFNTIGATGTQQLYFKAKNLDTASTIRAMIGIREYTP